jgi:hypothetical protein
MAVRLETSGNGISDRGDQTNWNGALASNSHGGVDSQQKTTGNGPGEGVYVDPGATATANTETLISGKPGGYQRWYSPK